MADRQRRVARNFTAKLRLRQLMVVVTLAEYGNMHRTADELGMTQSTVSKLLKELEGLLSVPLFERESRGMRVTDLGREVVAFAIETLTRIDRFAEEFEIKTRGGHGLLALGAIMGAAPDLIAKAIAELKADRPRLAIRMLGETSDQILDLLENGTLDLAVGRFSTPRHWQLFDFEPLGEEPLELVVRSGHALTNQPNATLTEMHAWPWILQPQTTPVRQLLDGAFADMGLGTPSNYVESASIFAILQLLQNSEALALLPISVVRDHLRAGLLEPLHDPIGKKIRGFGIVRRRDEPLSQNAEAFVAKLRGLVV